MPESKRPEPAAAVPLPELVNRLAQEVAESQRLLMAAQQKLGSTTRSLEQRTQELTEARAALSLLLATLDSTSEGILALGHFGRAMHYNNRFMEMWQIPAEKLPALNEQSLLAMQLAQVKDPRRFLQDVEARKLRPDEAHYSVVELTDGRILEGQCLPQRVRGKRVGCVTTWRDVTERERLGRLVCALEAEQPEMVAEARASTW